jgi:nucleoid-associated protein YgaU
MTIFADSRYAEGTQFHAYDSRTGKVQNTVFRTWPNVVQTFFYYNWVEGDRIDLLSKNFYGRSDLWWHIMDINPQILNPFEIAPGTQIRIPRAQ